MVWNANASAFLGSVTACRNDVADGCDQHFRTRSATGTALQASVRPGTERLNGVNGKSATRENIRNGKVCDLGDIFLASFKPVIRFACT